MCISILHEYLYLYAWEKNLEKTSFHMIRRIDRMGLPQTDGGRYINIYIVVRSDDPKINITPIILCPENLFQTTKCYTSPDDRFLAFSAWSRGRITVPQHVTNQFVALNENHLHYYGAKVPLQCMFLCKTTSCVRPAQRTEFAD